MAKTILVVDDERDTLQMIRDLLEGEGYGVLTAESGAIALDMLRSETPDLIILDLMMPAMDGFEFVRRKSKEGIGEGVPIIVLTALDTFTYSDMFLSEMLGVCLFMYKPFRAARLLENVQEALRLSRPARA